MSFALPAASAPRVLADLLPAARARTALLVLSGAAAVGLAAQVAVPVPGTPVPLTLQTFTVLLVGAALGAGRGAASMLLYGVAGAAGMPWFAGGQAGLVFASSGYVAGFVLAAALVGWCAERRGDRSVMATTGTMVLGTAVIYACGVAVLMPVAGLSFGAAVTAGVTPFIVGDALKVAVAATLLPSAWKLVGPR